MKRVCGMLIPLVKSQKYPYASLWNNILLNERFNHLKYKTEFYDQIFSQKEEKEWPSYRVFSSSLYDDEYKFYSPSKKNKKKCFVKCRIKKIKRNLYCYF